MEEQNQSNFFGFENNQNPTPNPLDKKEEERVENSISEPTFEPMKSLPNAKTILILGIFSFLASCCCTGFIGLPLGIIGLVLSSKDMKLYKINPEAYQKDYGNLNIGRIFSIIGIIFGIFSILFSIYIFSTGGQDEWVKEFMKGYEQGLRDSEYD